MDFREAIRGRRSVRRYTDEEIPSADLRAIVEEATMAPSASNRQMWKFWAIVDKDVLDNMRKIIQAKIAEMARWTEAEGIENKILASKNYCSFFANAPACYVVLGERYQSVIDKLLQNHGLTQFEIDQLRARPDLQSIGGAIQTLLLSAQSKGYGTCWMTGPLVAARELEELLNVDEGWNIVALVPIGRPDEVPDMRPKKEFSEIFKVI